MYKLTDTFVLILLIFAVFYLRLYNIKYIVCSFFYIFNCNHNHNYNNYDYIIIIIIIIIINMKNNYNKEQAENTVIGVANGSASRDVWNNCVKRF